MALTEKDRAREAAYRHLEHRSRTVKEMRTHLKQKGFDEADIEELLDELKEHNYLNDVEYGVLFIEYCRRKLRGSRRIRMELFDRGVCEDDVREAFARYAQDRDVDLEEEEYRTARAAAEKELERIPFDPRWTDRLSRRMTVYGFEGEVVFRVVSDLVQEINLREFGR